jgi:hypothetical protein
MAKSDYRCCDICDQKVFYDANLNYADADERPDNEPFKYVGVDQYDNPNLQQKYAIRLDYLGDWAVLCNECAKTHKCQIVEIVK